MVFSNRAIKRHVLAATLLVAGVMMIGLAGCAPKPGDKNFGAGSGGTPAPPPPPQHIDPAIQALVDQAKAIPDMNKRHAFVDAHRMQFEGAISDPNQKFALTPEMQALWK